MPLTIHEKIEITPFFETPGVLEMKSYHNRVTNNIVIYFTGLLYKCKLLTKNNSLAVYTTISLLC